MKIFKIFKRKTSGYIARERLKQLLLNDRMNLTTDLSDKIHRDLSKCISKYFEVDNNLITVDFIKNPDTEEYSIHAIIPVYSMKQRI